MFRLLPKGLFEGGVMEDEGIVKVSAILLVSFAIGLMFFTNCKNADSVSSSSNTSVSQSPQPRQLTLDEEANQEARNYWNNLFSKCGESYFWLETGSGMGTARVFEAKGQMSVNVYGSQPKKRELSKADELNQVEQPKEQWIGKSWVEFEVWRYGDYYNGSIYQWTQWKDRTSNADKQRLEEMKKYMPPETYRNMQATQAQARMDMKKINNQWQFQAWGVTHPLQKIDCAKIPSN